LSSRLLAQVEGTPEVSPPVQVGMAQVILAESVET